MKIYNILIITAFLSLFMISNVYGIIECIDNYGDGIEKCINKTVSSEKEKKLFLICFTENGDTIQDPATQCANKYIKSKKEKHNLLKCIENEEYKFERCQEDALIEMYQDQ